MSRYAFIFPGQGSQYVGMCKTLYNDFATAQSTFDEASIALGFDLKKVIFEGPKDELDRTEVTQPALLTASIAALRVLEQETAVSPACLAGHSLGEYTALVAAGALDFSDAVRLVRLRGRLMQEAAPPGAGMMCAILGLGAEAVTAICREASQEGSVVVPANLNSPQQVVISGYTEAVKRAMELAAREGAKRVIPLSVSAPSHSPLMEGAAVKFTEELDKVNFNGFSAPVISNVEASPVSDASRVKELLGRQLTSPVRWVDIINCMTGDGVDLVVEIGPGKVLTGLVKRIDRALKAANINETDDIEGAVALISRP